MRIKIMHGGPYPNIVLDFSLPRTSSPPSPATYAVCTVDLGNSGQHINFGQPKKSELD